MNLSEYIQSNNILKNENYYPTVLLKNKIMEIISKIQDNNIELSLFGINTYNFLLNKKDINHLSLPIQIISETKNITKLIDFFVKEFYSEFNENNENKSTFLHVIEGINEDDRIIKIAGINIVNIHFISKKKLFLINREIINTYWGKMIFIIDPLFLMNDFYLKYIQPDKNNEWIELLNIEKEWNEQFAIDKENLILQKQLKNTTIQNKNKKNENKLNMYFQKICEKINEKYTDFIISGSWSAKQMGIDTGDFNSILVKDKNTVIKIMKEIFKDNIEIINVKNDSNYFSKTYYVLIKIKEKEINFLLHELKFTFNYLKDNDTGFKRTNFHGTILYFLYIYYNSWDKPILKKQVKDIIENLWLEKNKFFKINVENNELDEGPFQIFQIKNKLGNYYDFLEDKQSRILSGKICKLEKLLNMDLSIYVSNHK